MNRSFLFRLAACRTRASPVSACSFRRCVRHALGLCAFPLAETLPSTSSSGGCPPSFGRFVGITVSSDFPSSFIIGLQPLAFPMRPAPPYGAGEDGISRFSRRKVPHVQRVFDLGGSDGHSR